MIKKAGASVLVLVMMALLLGTMACGQPAAAPDKPKVLDYPTKDLTLIVPFKPGGAFDTSARIVAPFIEKYLPKKVNVVVKNVAGALGKLGLAELAKSGADGYTMAVFEPFQFAVHRACGETEIADVSAFTYLGRVQKVPFMLALSGKGTLKTLADIKGQKLSVTTGTEMFAAASVVKALGAKEFVPVVFDSGPEGVLAAMRGDANAVFVTYPTVMKSVGNDQGKLYLSLVTSDKRQPGAPDALTPAEAGLNLPEAVLYSNIVVAAPAGVPQDVADVLSGAVLKATSDPEYIAQMEKAGLVPAVLEVKDAKTLIASMSKTADSGKDLYCPLRTQ